MKVYDCGGFLWYRKRGDEQVMSGHVRASPHGVLHLQALILAGQRVVLCLHGHEFYRREALITNPTWFTYGHPDFMEDLAWEIEKAAAQK